MKTFHDYSWTAAKWLAAFVLAKWTSIPVAIATMWGFMAMDFATGIFASVSTGKPLSSDVGLRGLSRKVLITFLVFLSHLMEKAFGMEFGAEKAVAIAYTANEAISIIENCAKGGVPILLPDSVSTILKKLTQDRPIAIIPGPPSSDARTPANDARPPSGR